MTDKQRVEHILKLRKKYSNRDYNYESDIKGNKFSHWVYVFSILDLWNADDDVIQLFYQELAAQISYSKWERKERKRKGYERLKEHLYPFTWLGHKHINKIQQYERVNNIK